MLATTTSSMRSRLSGVLYPWCGESTTFGRSRSGDPAASGSVSNTSSAAAIRPSASTRSSAPGAISSGRAGVARSAPGVAPAPPAVADDARRLAGQLDALPDVPLPRPDGAIAADDPLGQREGEGEGVLGDGGVAVAGDVGDRDAAVGCGRQVDEGGRAGAGERDQPEVWQPAEHRSG